MMFLNLQLIQTGVSNAFWISSLVEIEMDGLKGNEYTYKKKQSLAEWGMVVFGLGEVIGSIIVGPLIDAIGPRRSSFFNLLIVIMMTSFTALQIE
jgi:MFS family permease